MANKILKNVLVITKNIWKENELRYHFSLFKLTMIKNDHALTGVAQWVKRHPTKRKVAASILVRARA